MPKLGKINFKLPRQRNEHPFRKMFVYRYYAKTKISMNKVLKLKRKQPGKNIYVAVVNYNKCTNHTYIS